MNYIVIWVHNTLDESTLGDNEKDRLRATGVALAKEGHLKGDISDAWRRIYPWLNATHIPDLYV